MTSPTEDIQHSITPSRQRIAAILILTMLTVGGAEWIWHRHGTYNIFDDIMVAEWAVSTVSGNPAMNEKYDGWLSRSPDAPFATYRQRLEYRSRAEKVSISIRPDHDETDCSELGCTTTWWKEKTPTEMEIFYSETLTDKVWFAVGLTYDRHKHSAHQQVEVYRGELLDDDDATAVLAEHGITGDYLRERRDWLLYDKVLPDLLAANPSVTHTVHKWGFVKVTSDRFLTS